MKDRIWKWIYRRSRLEWMLLLIGIELVLILAWIYFWLVIILPNSGILVESW